MKRLSQKLFLFLFGSLLTSVGAMAPDLAQLVQQLSGTDDVARSEARQFLAREGAEAVPKILPLIGHENESVWRAASNVLADIAHEVSVPGREGERVVVAQQLITLVSQDRSTELKERGLRLLPLIVPDGFNVDPIATLLDDSEIREKARTCLEEIGTAEARAALCKALDAADPEFVCAILDSLGEVGPGGCVPKIRNLMESEDSHTRIAAARALATIPNLETSGDFWEVVKRSTTETRFEAERALLAYLESLGMKPDVANLYARAVQEFSFASTRGAAIIGLAQTGGIGQIDRIVEAVSSGATDELDAPTIAALENLQGDGVPKALIAAYPKVSSGLQLRMLHLFGRSGDRELGMFVADQIGSEDSLVRQEALRALSASGLLEPLVVAVQKSSAENRTIALEILLAAARRYEGAGDSNLAGEAFLRLHELADTNEIRREALSGMGRNPTPVSLDVLLAAIKGNGFGEETSTILVRLCRKLSESGDLESQKKALAEIQGRANTTEAVREILHLSAATSSKGDIAKSLGFVTSWSVVGPFPWDPQSGFSKINVGEPAVDLSAVYGRQGSELRWEEFSTSDPLATVNLGTAIGMLDKVCAYAFAEIEVGEETEAEVRAGSDDGIRIWLNGAVVHENLVDRGSDLDQDRAPVHLMKGKNALLVQVTQGGGGWNFLLRLTQPDGAPLAFK